MPGRYLRAGHDGTLKTLTGPSGVWPGDGTPYRIRVMGQGTRAALQGTLNDLKGKLKPKDLVFIHAENEALYDGESSLATYPAWAAYHATEFAADLAGLPRYRSLTVLMAQCYAGGFSAPILAKSTADDTSVACATSAVGSVAPSLDGNFSKFGSDWVSAQIGHDPFGAPLASNPDTDGNGVIEAEEAFAYALSIRSQIDLPNFSESSEAGGDITLGQRYIFWPWWCWLVLPILERYYDLPLTGPEFYAKVHAALPQLEELVVPLIDRTTRELRAQMTPEVESVLASVFGPPRSSLS